MIMKNSDIIKHLNQIPLVGNVELPVNITYAINKNHRKLVKEYEDYETQLEKLQDKYPNLDKDNPELLELLAIEVPIDFHMIPEAVFLNGTFNITPSQIEILEFMIQPE